MLAAEHKRKALDFAEGLRPVAEQVVGSGARTTREVAEVLNLMDVPSREGGRWHHASAARLLRRLELSTFPVEP